jgi:hypothetical protein
MDWNIVYYIIVPAALMIGGWLMKSHVERISTLEKEVQNKTTEVEVRMILADKMDPMREDIHELKATVDKILDILLKKIN